MRFLAIALMVLTLSACGPARESSDAAARVSKRSFDETREAWREVFTFHPKKPEQAPQTRYCYQMQSDIACYDAPQIQMTSKLVGYQEGGNISFIQQGGGSLGVSAAPQQVFAPSSTTSYSDSEMMAPVDTGDYIEQSNMPPPVPNASGCVEGSSPFNCKESTYVPGVDVGR